jgi:hypothetical protein
MILIVIIRVMAPCSLVGQYQCFNPEDGSSMFLQNVGDHLPDGSTIRVLPSVTQKATVKEMSFLCNPVAKSWVRDEAGLPHSSENGAMMITRGKLHHCYFILYKSHST